MEQDWAVRWLLVQHVLVGGGECRCDGPVDSMKAWEFGLRVRTCSDDFSPWCIASRSGGRIGRWEGREAVCSLAIQGRVSQNLRLIQVIFGHSASEGKCVCVLCACV